jgi:hypothetical protein
LLKRKTKRGANNASAQFVIRFQIKLGGTAVPYMRRLEVLDELLATNRPSLVRLLVKALAQAATPDVDSIDTDPIWDELPEQEWQPRTPKEHFDCVEKAMERLSTLPS